MQPFFTNVVSSEPLNSFCVARGSVRLSSANPSLKGHRGAILLHVGSLTRLPVYFRLDMSMTKR